MRSQPSPVSFSAAENLCGRNSISSKGPSHTLPWAGDLTGSPHPHPRHPEALPLSVVPLDRAYLSLPPELGSQGPCFSLHILVLRTCARMNEVLCQLTGSPRQQRKCDGSRPG